MSEQYTPTTEDVRQEFIARAFWNGEREYWLPLLKGQFDRWLEDVRAEAWDGGYKSGLDTGLIIGEFTHGIIPGPIPGPAENPYQRGAGEAT